MQKKSTFALNTDGSFEKHWIPAKKPLCVTFEKQLKVVSNFSKQAAKYQCSNSPTMEYLWNSTFIEDLHILATNKSS